MQILLKIDTIKITVWIKTETPHYFVNMFFLETGSCVTFELAKLPRMSLDFW